MVNLIIEENSTSSLSHIGQAGGSSTHILIRRVHPDRRLKLTVDLMPLKCRGDFIQEENELAVHIVGDLAGFHSNCNDAEGLQALDDFSEGVGGDLASAREGHGGGASRAPKPIQVIEHGIAAILDLINEHLLVFAYQILQVEAHDDEDLISPEASEQCALLGIIELIKSSDHMLVVDGNQRLGEIPSIGRLVFLSRDFQCSFGHLKTTADIS